MATHLVRHTRYTFFHTQASLLIVFVCPIVLFQSCCSHAGVFGKTLVHEFPISYNHTEWYFLFSLFLQEKLNMPSGNYYWLCSRSGRSNHLIKLNFRFLIKYYHILFIIIVFLLGSDRLVSWFFYCLSKGQGFSHGVWPKKIYCIGIEQQLHEIVRGNNFALNCLSWKFTEMIMITNEVIPENLVVVR